MKKAVNFVKKNDGEFFQSIADFKNSFQTVTICKVHDDYDLEWIHHSKRDDGNLTKFTSEKGGNLFFTVAQVNPRISNKSDRYNVGKTRIVIAKLNEHDMLEYVSHKFEPFNFDTELELMLSPGTYVAWTQIEYSNPSFVSTYAVTIYGPDLSKPEIFDYPGAFGQILNSTNQKS